jgi:hypothetical protein
MNATFNGDFNDTETITAGFNGTFNVFHKGAELAKPINASGIAHRNGARVTAAAGGVHTLSSSTTLDLRILGGHAANAKCVVQSAHLSIFKVSK